MTQSTLNLWWALKPGDSGVVIDFRLMSLLTPELWSSLLLIPTFILGSWVRCHHLPIFLWNWGVRIIPFLELAVADF